MTPDRSCGAKYKPISCPSSFSPWAQGGRRVSKRVRGQLVGSEPVWPSGKALGW